MTRCLLSKCPDKQLEFRSIAPAYRNTFSVQAVYGLEGLEGVARALGGSLTFACFPGYSFLDAEAQHCGRVCTQPEDEADMRVLPWEISQNAPKSCETVVVLCTPASCPPAFGSFLGSYDFVDLWNPQRLRYFGSDVVFDPTQSANVENAMHDIYDQAHDYEKHPETTSCLGRWVGENPLKKTKDPGFYPTGLLPKTNYPSMVQKIGEPLCRLDKAGSYICQGVDLPDRMPDEESGFGHTSLIFDALNNKEFTPENAAAWEKSKHTKLKISEVSMNYGWQTEFGHKGAILDEGEDSIPLKWAHWERCLGMAQVVNLFMSGKFVLPSAENLPAVGIPKAGSLDALGAGFDGDATSHGGICPPDYEPTMGYADPFSSVLISPTLLDWANVIASGSASIDGPYLSFSAPPDLYVLALDRCRRLCNAKQTEPICRAFSWRQIEIGGAKTKHLCAFWSISRPSIYPSTGDGGQWCSRKKFLGGPQGNGVRYHYHGCYKFDPSLAEPSQYQPIEGELPPGRIDMLRSLTPSDEVYNIQACADKCRDFVFMAVPETTPNDVHAHWSKYHTRYFQIAAKPRTNPVDVVFAPCEPAQWIRDNFAPGRPLFGHGFWVDRSVKGNKCQSVDEATSQELTTAFINNDATKLDFSSKGNLFLPLATQVPPRAVESWKAEFFGLSLGSRCLCLPSFPPLNLDKKTKHREPNAMEKLEDQNECDATCADGLSSCGSGLSEFIFSVYMSDDRGLSTKSETGDGPGYSTSLLGMTFGTSCQYTDYTNTDFRNPPFCIGSENWALPKKSDDLPDGRCHPNVCGTGVCCRTDQVARNCPVYDSSAVNVLERPRSAGYKLDPFERFTCQTRPGVRPQDPIDRQMDTEPLRYIRYWQTVSDDEQTCDPSGENHDPSRRCKNTGPPIARSCNALYDTDLAYLKIPIESEASSPLESLTELEGMTLEAVKGLNVVPGANRVAFRPKVTHRENLFPLNDLPQALSFCRVYKERRPHPPSRFIVQSLHEPLLDKIRPIFGGARTDWLEFFGPTAEGECAVYGGSSPGVGSYYEVVDSVLDGNQCAWQCGRNKFCGHWVHDGRDRRCFLYRIVWFEARRKRKAGTVVDWKHQIMTRGPPCSESSGLGQNSAVSYVGKQSLSIASVGRDLGYENFAEPYSVSRFSLFHYQKNVRALHVSNPYEWSTG